MSERRGAVGALAAYAGALGVSAIVATAVDVTLQVQLTNGLSFTGNIAGPAYSAYRNTILFADILNQLVPSLMIVATITVIVLVAVLAMRRQRRTSGRRHEPDSQAESLASS